MSITKTTLASALSASDTILNVASATGITAPNFQTGSGITVLQIEEERLLVISAPNGTFIPVLRGQSGTVSAAHANGATVLIGIPTDFATFIQALGSLITNTQTLGSRVQKAVNLTGSADAVLSSVPGYYIIFTAGVDAVTLPTPVAGDEGNIIEIWSASDNAHTVTAASACIGVGSASGLRTVATFPAKIGAGICLRVCNLLYHLLYSSGTGTNSGPIVWT
jgi:hypothetical protein